MKKTRFTAEQFRPTQWDTAEEKARFANAFVRFVESDFKATLFPKTFYRRLSMTFGHIAHYDQGGFYATFFTTALGKVRFLEQCVTWDCCGDPAYTYSDVETALRAWIKAEGLVETYQAKLCAAVEASERAQLARLVQKYGVDP